MYYILLSLLVTGLSCNTVTRQPRDFPASSNSSRQVAPLECGATDRLQDGEYTTIESQNYPAQYPNNHNCLWTIKVPKNAYVYFSCNSLDIGKGDLLTVGGSLTVKLSGNSDSEDYFGFAVPMKTTTLKVRFKTNRKTRGDGFRFISSSVGCF